ncbi:MAG: hypothetical protein NT025_09485 [bacterium]|nr:hypothetical protein [bacterium]
MISRAERLAAQRRIRVQAVAGGAAVFLLFWLLMPYLQYSYTAASPIDREIERILAIKKPTKSDEPKPQDRKQVEKPKERVRAPNAAPLRHLSTPRPAGLSRPSSLAGRSLPSLSSPGLAASPQRRLNPGSEGRRQTSNQGFTAPGGRRLGADLPDVGLPGGNDERIGGLEEGNGNGSGSRRGNGSGAGGGPGRIAFGGAGGGAPDIGLGGDGGGTIIRIPQQVEATPAKLDRSPIIDWIEKHQRDIPVALQRPECLDLRPGDVSTWQEFQDSQGKKYILYLVGRPSHPAQLNIFLLSGTRGTLLQDEGARGQTDVFKTGRVTGSGADIAPRLERLPAGHPEAPRMMSVFNAWWNQTRNRDG